MGKTFVLCLALAVAFASTTTKGHCDVTGHATVSVSPGDTSTIGPTASETATSTHSVNMTHGSTGTYYLIIATCGIDIDSNTANSDQYYLYQQADANGEGSYSFAGRTVTKACYFGMHEAHAQTRIDYAASTVAPGYSGYATPVSFTVTEL